MAPAVPVAARTTAYYEQPVTTRSEITSSNTMAAGSAYAAVQQETSLRYPAPSEQEGTDWLVITLGLLALGSLLGLVPLWYLVYLRYAG